MLFGGDVTDDGHYLIIHVSEGTSPKNRLYYKDLTQPDSPVVKLLDEFDAQYLFIDNDGPVFWFQTDLDAPRGRLIAIDTRHPERTSWKTVVPQGVDKLEFSNVVNNSFLLGISERRPHRSPRLRLERHIPAQRRPARHRHRRRFRRQAQRQRNFLRLHQLHLSRHRLSLRSRSRQERRLPPAQSRFRFLTLRNQTSLLRQQRRHPRPHVPDLQERIKARRTESRPALRLRRIRHLSHSSLLRPECSLA